MEPYLIEPSTNLGLRFHHFGLAVPRPDAAFIFLTSLGYTSGPTVFDPLQKVNLAMRHHALMPDVEVIWPGAEPSPIDRLIRQGHMVYHLCYIADDVSLTLAAIEQTGLEIVCVLEPRPAALFGGKQVSFYSIGQFGLIELLHGDPAH